MDHKVENQFIPLAQSFKEANRSDWNRLVEKALKGIDLGEFLVRSTYDGVNLKLLYSEDESGAERNDGDFYKYYRESLSSHRIQHGWNVQQFHDHPDPVVVNTNIQDDLSGGACSIALRINTPVNKNHKRGVRVNSLRDLDIALTDVDLTSTRLTLDAGVNAYPIALILIALANKRGLNTSNLTGTYGMDPIGALASLGSLQGPLSLQFEAAGKLAVWCKNNATNMRTFNVDTSKYHAAGATETEDLAFSMATGLAYLRSLIDAGLSIDEACSQISFNFSVGTEVFEVMAKLRAARKLWARVAEVSGANLKSSVMKLTAITATRVLSKRDIWVNLLRSTCACFAAGVAGADTITLYPHTHVLGLPKSSSRRLVRNIQNILIHESSISRVADPGGGSYYIEKLTDEFANKAWLLFQNIEKNGGMAKNVESGKVAKMTREAWNRRLPNLAHRRDQLIGISAFPDLHEELGESVTEAYVENIGADYEPEIGNEDLISKRGTLDTLVQAAGTNASIFQLAKPLCGSPMKIPSIVEHRLSEDFEALRDASDEWLLQRGRRPIAHVIGVGAVVEHIDRLNFLKNYLAAGGIATTEENIDVGNGSVKFSKSGSDIAVICSTDAIYESETELIVRSLNDLGAGVIALVGEPGESEGALRKAGVNYFFFPDDDILAKLNAVHESIGIIRP